MPRNPNNPRGPNEPGTVNYSRSGSRPKPISQMIADGDTSRKGKHKLEQLRANEPQSPSGLPDCPDHLSGLARRTWVFWAEQLKIMGLDKTCDAAALEGACMSYELAVSASAIWKREGLTLIQYATDEDSGERVMLSCKENPTVKISIAAWNAVRQFCGEFGLTPVSRTRLAMGSPKKEGDKAIEDLMKVLSKPRKTKTADKPNPGETPKSDASTTTTSATPAASTLPTIQ